MNLTNPISQLVRARHGETPIAWSGLSSVIAPALDERGLTFHQVHHEPEQMVVAAAAAHELYGWGSATLPTDLIVEAEAFGARIDFRADMPEPMWSFVAEPFWETPAEAELPSGEFYLRGRIPEIVLALGQLRRRVGEDCIVGAWIPGPFTLALQLVDYLQLLPAVKQEPHNVSHAVRIATEALIATADAYVLAGADIITIHEMGGSPGVIGHEAFEQLVLPYLQILNMTIHAPTLLSVCGNTNRAMSLLAEVGADGIGVDQLNDLARSRATLGSDAVLCGNIDPVGVIAHGTPEKIRAAVAAAYRAGAEIVMPGCDLYLATPAENLRAYIDAVRAMAPKN